MTAAASCLLGVTAVNSSHWTWTVGLVHEFFMHIFSKTVWLLTDKKFKKSVLHVFAHFWISRSRFRYCEDSNLWVWQWLFRHPWVTSQRLCLSFIQSLVSSHMWPWNYVIMCPIVHLFRTKSWQHPRCLVIVKLKNSHFQQTALINTNRVWPVSC